MEPIQPDPRDQRDQPILSIQRISSDQTLGLRQKVLRPQLSPEECRFPQDAHSVHFGVFAGGELVSLVSAHPEDSPLFLRKGQWRIRGMATDPRFQSQGLGGKVLQALVVWAREAGIPLFWCNARERAIPFYERHGFTVESELFEIPTVGPHQVMKLELGRENGAKVGGRLEGNA